MAMKEGYLMLQEWRTGRNQDSFRRAVLVGNTTWMLKGMRIDYTSGPSRVLMHVTKGKDPAERKRASSNSFPGDIDPSTGMNH